MKAPRIALRALYMKVGRLKSFDVDSEGLSTRKRRNAVKVLDADLTSREAISIPHYTSETQVSRKAPIHRAAG